MEPFRIEIKGLNELKRKLAAAPGEFHQVLSQAGQEAGERILDTEGLRHYPPETEANQPPTPYYIRGRGTQYKSRNRGNSERYGTQFYVRADALHTKIGNRASYARWLTDEKLQARIPASRGWRKLIDVARENRKLIVRIYEAWIKYALRRGGL